MNEINLDENTERNEENRINNKNIQQENFEVREINENNHNDVVDVEGEERNGIKNSHLNEDIHNTEKNHYNINTEKFFFFKFLMNYTTLEYYYDKFQQILLFVSIVEFIGAIILCCVGLGILLVLLFPHLIRVVFAIIILCCMPLSHQILEEKLTNTENYTIEEINEIIKNAFLETMKNKGWLKACLIVYFILTIIDILIDAIIMGFYFYYTANESDVKQNY